MTHFLDDIGRDNRRLWIEWAADKCLYTQPWSDLRRSLSEECAEGRVKVLPRPHMYIYLRSVLQEAPNKEVHKYFAVVARKPGAIG